MFLWFGNDFDEKEKVFLIFLSNLKDPEQFSKLAGKISME